MLGQSRRVLPERQGEPPGDSEKSPHGPWKPITLDAPCLWGDSVTKKGLFLSMLCLSGLNTTSGLLPPPPPAVIQLQEGSQEG